MDPGFLLAADIHVTPKPRDAYRWQIFDFLARHVVRLGVQTVVLSGDLGDAKDRHPSTLVNMLVAALGRLACEADIVIIKGNHDYIDAANPFFGFLNELDEVKFITEPGVHVIGGLTCLCLPHARDWNVRSDWRKKNPLAPAGGGRYDYLLAHQTFAGSLASNGDRMQGVPLATVSAERTNGAPVLSGDIHVPQRVGNVTYVGAPHPVYFGDDFEPRILHVRKDGIEAIPNPTVLARHMLQLTPAEVEGDWARKIFEKDQCKVQLAVARQDVLDISKLRERIKARIAEAGGEHFGTDVTVVEPKVRRRLHCTGQAPKAASDAAIFERYCTARSVPDEYVVAGRKYL